MKLQNIRIVLVEPSHPGNIGAAARAMKNMGIKHLYLIDPKRFPDNEAIYRASGADDIVENAVVVTKLADAIADCEVVFGTSTRDRVMPQPLINVKDAAYKIIDEFENAKIAILFGPEKFGLSNEDLMHCHYHVRIPTVDGFSSLNLAAAVQVVAYELYITWIEAQKLTYKAQSKKNRGRMATIAEMEGLYQHIEKAMTEINFLDPAKPRKLMQRIRRLINRSHIDRDDLDLLRGMMTAVQKKAKNLL
jgi:tRNA (cytidine32/uridine32-2'-O)-methyltransferase